MSLPEVLLWRELRGKPLGLKFRRQYPILGFVADFACVEVRLLIEIDGIVHDMGDRPQRDAERNGILAGRGWRIERIGAKEVLRNPVEAAGAIVALAESLRPLRPFGAPPRSGEDRGCASPNPPRNGEVAARRADGGVVSSLDQTS